MYYCATNVYYYVASYVCNTSLIPRPLPRNIENVGVAWGRGYVTWHCIFEIQTREMS